jgi:hypothetical protein
LIYDAIVKENNEVIKNWIKELNTDKLSKKSMIDQLFDAIELGEDRGEDLIAFLEKELD